MTPRERILTACSHREPDRIPVDFSGHRSSGISALLYPKLRAALGLPRGEVRIYDPVQQLAVVDEDVLDRFGIDTIELGRGFAQEDADWSDWVLPDGTPCKIVSWATPHREDGRWVLKSQSGSVLGQMVDGSVYFEQTCFPLMDDPGMKLEDALNECMWTAVGSPPGPTTAGPQGRRRLRDGAKRMRSQTDRAIIGLFGGNLLEIGEFLFRMDRFLEMLVGDPKAVHDFLDRLVEHHLKVLEEYLADVGQSIDIILFGDDLGMQTGPLMSPAMYREFFKPRHEMMWRRAKELADVRVQLHCCGGVSPLIPDLIDAGLDILNPIQTSCAGMDPAYLKREFGNDLVLWGGGCDTQHMLPEGTPDEVKEHVRERIAILAPGGGFVFQQVHNILAYVPPENVIAMFDGIQQGAAIH